MKEFVTTFKSLLDAGKLEEAKQLLSTFGSLPESAEERAELKLFLTDMYVVSPTPLVRIIWTLFTMPSRS